ncbi:MAG TPA: hypothetical protein VFS30_08180 [Dehalococcoidia bacterium]|nr:hypothetical protein [Dehalococcoidia bacterium]
MGFLLIALRGSLLATTAMTGAIAAYHGVPVLFDYGYDAGNVLTVLAFAATMAGALLGGGLYLLEGRKRLFRIHAGGALLLFGLALITVNSVGYYFLTPGALAVLSLCVLATKRPSDGDEPYRWLRGAVRVRNRRPAGG